VYGSEKVAKFINDHFIPVKIHVKEQPEAFGRFGAEWTPTVLVADANEKEQHRIEGFLPAPDFTAQLNLGLAHAARSRGDFAEAEKIYRQLATDDAHEDVAAESLYWAGVAKYKATNEAAALADTAAAFKQRFTNSAWAKKSSVWGS
jgi:hypothetical protein